MSKVMTENEARFRCTVCGLIGTVGRCCGRDTREPLNEAARVEVEAEAHNGEDTVAKRWES
ncbi:MAG: hypothetical protein K9N51_02370 [Candidatus Pacebacteria bacterium]|nr:hypothetical protein [Candidatus Paceibacterota bacterium]